MRVVCFHGRREIGGEALFLSTARIFAGAANHAGFSAQVRTPGFPSPPGSPDRAVVKISREQLPDLAIPAEYDLEVVCDPLLAVVPPMGGALKPGGVLVLNMQRAPSMAAISASPRWIPRRHRLESTPQRPRRLIWARRWPAGTRSREGYRPKTPSRHTAKSGARRCARRKRRRWPRPPLRRKAH